jgi:cysteine desulfurase
MLDFRQYIANNCDFALNDIYESDETQNTKFKIGGFKILFTSCASESNSSFIRMIVSSYIKMQNMQNMQNKIMQNNVLHKPHIIISSIEHKSSLLCIADLLEKGEIEVTFVYPDCSGSIPPEKIEKSIRPNTALISIMWANNEIGAINDIESIGKIAKKHCVPFHTDAVQTFGKFKLKYMNLIDAVSVSSHKFYGPPGLGLLIINSIFIIYIYEF